MSKSTSSSPDDRWYRAQVPVRLAGLAAILIGVVEIPPGVGTSGRPLAVSISATVASLAWLLLIRPPRRRPVLLALVLLLVVSGGVVTGLTPGGPAVALAAVGVFEAVVVASVDGRIGVGTQRAQDCRGFLDRPSGTSVDR